MFYNCLSCLLLCYLKFPYKTLNPKATTVQIKISYFKQWDNAYCSVAKRTLPVSQSLYGLFLWTNSISLKTAEKWSIAPLPGWLAPCTISKTHLHLHSLKPITRVPRTATQIPSETAKIRSCSLLKRPRKQSKLRSRKRFQPTQLFTSSLPVQQSQLNQWYSDHPLRDTDAFSHWFPLFQSQRYKGNWDWI